MTRRVPPSRPSGPSGPSRRSGLHGPAAPVLERLFAARGLAAGTWRAFLVQEEGEALPGGLESLSGFVLTRSGDVFGWWLDWDARAPGPGGAGPRLGDYVLSRWWRVGEPERELGADGEYRRARERLGLASL